MTNKQDANSEAESLESAQHKATQISPTPEKDALSEKSLDDVSGGAWPSPHSSYCTGLAG